MYIDTGFLSRNTNCTSLPLLTVKHMHYTVCNNKYDMNGNMYCGKAGVSILYTICLCLSTHLQNIILKIQERLRLLSIELTTQKLVIVRTHASSKLSKKCIHTYINLGHASIKS